ncbi:MAG: twitching motility protein PilT [Pseudomonadota bacterium]
MSVNWVAAGAGVIVSFMFGYLVYGPVLGLQRRWAEGSSINPEPPAQMPMGSMAAQIISLALLSSVVAITATTDSLGLAVLAILAVAAQAASVGSWAQKSGFAISVDTGYAIGCGILMILCHAIL